MEKFESTDNKSEAEWAERQAEADDLRRVLAARLGALVSEGIFTNKEARLWLDSCEDDPPEWVQELLDALGDYEDSGAEVLEEIDEVLASPVFVGAEKKMWRGYAEDATYHEKLAVKGRLESIRKTREAERKKIKPDQAVGADELVEKIRRAIRGGKLEEASVFLEKLNPADYRISYERLSKDLTEAKLRQAYEQYDRAVIAA